MVLRVAGAGNQQSCELPRTPQARRWLKSWQYIQRLHPHHTHARDLTHKPFLICLCSCIPKSMCTYIKVPHNHITQLFLHSQICIHPTMCVQEHTHTHNTTKDNHKGWACHSGSQSWVRDKGASQGPPCMSFFQRGGYTRWAHSASKKHEVGLYSPTCQGESRASLEKNDRSKDQETKKNNNNGEWILDTCHMHLC